MKATMEVINRMRTDGVIGKYAIDGAVGATFYLEPSATLDSILSQHGLLAKWEQFGHRYFGDDK